MDLRKVEVLRKGKWVEVNFSDLHNGDTFRMFESTGEPVIDDEGNAKFIATSEPYEYEGVWAIDI